MELNDKRRQIEIALRTNDWLDHIDRLSIFSIIDANIPEEVEVLKDVLFVEKGLEEEVFNEYLDHYQNKTHIIQKEEKSIGLKDKLLEIIDVLPVDYEQKDIEEILAPILRSEIVLKNKIFKAIKKKTGLNKPDLETIFNFCHEKQKDEKQEESEEFKEELLSEDECNKLLVGFHEKPIVWLKNNLKLVHEGNEKNGIYATLFWIGIYFGIVSQIMLVGEASSGKSDLMNRIIAYMKEDDFYRIGYSTGACLRDLGTIANNKKALVFSEKESTNKEDPQSELMLKLFSGDDKESFALIRERDDNGNFITVEKKILSKPYITTYAKTDIDSEKSTRLLVIEVNQGFEQTKSVIRKRVLIPEDIIIAKENLFLKKTQAFKQKIIPMFDSNSCNVIIPFVEKLNELFSGDYLPHAIRDINRFKEIIKTSTLFHKSINQNGRAIKEEKEIKWYIAEPQDFVIACELGYDIIKGNIKGLKPQQEDMLNAVKELYGVEKEDDTKKTRTIQQTLSIKSDENKIEESKETEIKGITPKEILNYCGIKSNKNGYGHKQLRNLYYQYGLIEPVDSIETKRGIRIKSYKPTGNSNDNIANWKNLIKEIIELTNQYFEKHLITKTTEELYYFDE